MLEEWSLRKPKIMISAMQLRRMLTNGCVGFLASVVDKYMEEKLEPKSVPIVKEFIEVFLEELRSLPPEREISLEIELLPIT